MVEKLTNLIGIFQKPEMEPGGSHFHYAKQF